MPPDAQNTSQNTGTEAGASNAGGSSTAGGTGAAAQGAGASGGGQTGAAAGAAGTDGRSNTAAGAAGEDKSGDRIRALEARESELKQLLDDAIGQRKTVAEKLSAAQAELEQERSGRTKAEGAIRTRASVDAIVGQVPSAHRTAATDALFRMHAEGVIDLSGEDREAVVKTAIEKLKAERASYFEAASTVPRIPGVNTGGVVAQKVGVTDPKGNRLI